MSSKEGKLIAMEQVKVFKFSNCTATVLIPDLTDEERARRIKTFKEATARFILAAEAQKEKEREKNG